MRLKDAHTMIHDPWAQLHDLEPWGQLKPALRIGAMVEIEWRQDHTSVLSRAGSSGRFVAKFGSRGRTYKEVLGWWEVDIPFVKSWCPAIMREAKKRPNTPFEVNNLEERESPTAVAKHVAAQEAAASTRKQGESSSVVAYKPMRNKHGKLNGVVFQEQAGDTAREAHDLGLDALEFSEHSGCVTNVSQMYFNKGHPTNEFLFRLGTEAAATRVKPVPDPLTNTQVTWNTNHVEEVDAKGKKVYVHGYLPAEFKYSQAEDAVFSLLSEEHTTEPTIYGCSAAFIRQVFNADELDRLRLSEIPYKWHGFTTGKTTADTIVEPDCIVEAMVLLPFPPSFLRSFLSFPYPCTCSIATTS
jgi:hypothetical protein